MRNRSTRRRTLSIHGADLYTQHVWMVRYGRDVATRRKGALRHYITMPRWNPVACIMWFIIVGRVSFRLHLQFANEFLDRDSRSWWRYCYLYMIWTRWILRRDKNPIQIIPILFELHEAHFLDRWITYAAAVRKLAKSLPRDFQIWQIIFQSEWVRLLCAVKKTLRSK